MISVQQFLTKNGRTPVSHHPYSPYLTSSVFFVVVSSDEKSPERETFADMEEVKQKNGRSTIKIDELEDCFEQRKMSQ